MLGNSLRRVIKFRKSVTVGNALGDAVLDEHTPQALTKRLCHWKEDTSVRDRITLHEVEISIGIGAVVVVETVGANKLYDRLALNLRLRDI